MTQNNEDIKTEENSETTTEETTESPVEKSELELAQEEIKHLKDQLLRTLADADNTRKRLEKSQVDTAKFAISDFAKELIPVLDIFKKAFESFDESKIEDANIKSFVEGIKMTEKVLEKTLNKFGIIAINPIGEKLDPNFHETLYARPDNEKEDGTIAEVMEIGYKIHDRILRSAKVGIIKN